MTTAETLSEPTRIGVCGLGTIGKLVAKLLLDGRSGIEVVGAATLEEGDIGKPLGQVVDAKAAGPTVSGSLAELLEADPALVVLCTGSFLPDVMDSVLACAEAGVDVISPCEELAFPFNRFPDQTSRIETAAQAGGATILGSGVNPGFTFDSLLAALTGVCWDVEQIRGRRVVDTNGFGQNIHLRLGIGYTLEDFEAGHRDGSIAGHVGFPESIELVCERLGLKLDGPVEQEFEPLIAATPAPTRYGQVDVGLTEGFIQTATGRVDGEPRVRIELVLHLRPTEAGYKPSDSIEIDGAHPVRMVFDPGMDALFATSAELVNQIPSVLAAKPGLTTVKDLPAAAAWLGDLRAATIR